MPYFRNHNKKCKKMVNTNSHHKPNDNIETVLISLQGEILGGESNPPSLGSHEDNPYEIVICKPSLLKIYLSSLLKSSPSETLKEREAEFSKTVSKALKNRFTLFLPSALSFANIGDSVEVIFEDGFKYDSGRKDYGFGNLPILGSLVLRESMTSKAIVVYRNNRVIDGYNLRGLDRTLFPPERYSVGARRE